MAAVRLEPTEAITILTQALKQTSDPKAVSLLAQGLSQVAGRLDSKDAAAATAPAAAALTRAIGEAKDTGLQPLKQGLAAVAARLGPEDTVQVVAALTQAMMETKNPNTLSSLAILLSLVAARQGPKDAAIATAPAATALTRAIIETKNNKEPLAAGARGCWRRAYQRWRPASTPRMPPPQRRRPSPPSPRPLRLTTRSPCLSGSTG